MPCVPLSPPVVVVVVLEIRTVLRQQALQKLHRDGKDAGSDGLSKNDRELLDDGKRGRRRSFVTNPLAIASGKSIEMTSRSSMSLKPQSRATLEASMPHLGAVVTEVCILH